MSYAVADAHNDFLMLLRDGGALDVESGQHMTLTGIKKANLKLAIFAAFSGRRDERDRALKNVLRMIDCYHGMIEKHGFIHLAPGVSTSTVSAGEVGTVLAVEGADALEGQIELLRVLHRLGVRLVTLTWNHRNDLADGVGETEGAGGLTSFGREVVLEMNRLKMCIDVSHLNKQGFWDVMKHSTAPIIASHSNTESVWKHPRNLDDEQIKAIIRSGGFIGVNFYSAFIGEGAIRTEHLMRHVDHFMELGAEDALGFGSDFDGISAAPEGIDGVGDFGKIISALLDAGYTEAQVKKLAYNNLANYLDKFV